ncbi:outer membrane beta-barrel protein [Helicobacter pylori]|nr:outer membrane beta-barrel protein [Helicobacter pylori]
MKKTLLTLSLALTVPLLNAEDDGFYMSVGYQIGEAVQQVKNTGALQNLADRYDNLSNLLNQYNYLNSLVNLASTPSAITGAIDNLSSSAINLTSATTTSPAYQAVALALNAAVGMWQVIALFIGCGPGPTNNQSYQSFGNTPALNGTTTTCNQAYGTGPNGILSIEEYQKLNQAYQIIQTALNQNQGGGMPALNDTTKTGVVNIQQTNYKTTTQNNIIEHYYTENGKEIPTSYSGGSSLPLSIRFTFNNNAEYLLQQAATIMQVLTTQNPNSPEGLLTYSLDTNKYSQLQTTAQELGKNPFRRIGVIDYQNNNGAMNGIGVQVGYKQFFGKKRNWGLRYYGFFDYNHAYIKSNFFNSASDVWTYGVGMDTLYNFINDKNTNFLGKNNKLSVGLFGGFALAGTSWLNSQQVNLTMMNGIYNTNVSTSNFQFLFDLGLRMNLARPKKKDSDHAAQHGIELGFKIPTINTSYYSFMGAKLEYRRMYSLFLNYVFAY